MKLNVLPEGPGELDPGYFALVDKHAFFETIQGEGTLAGVPSLFMRLFGCNDTCSWCDTKYSWQDGEKNRKVVEVKSVVEFIIKKNPRNIVITGGEPTLQTDAIVMLLLSMAAHMNTEPHITIETNGTHFDPLLADCVNLVSLSPKLHTLQENNFNISEPMFSWLYAAQAKKTLDAQVKIVVGAEEIVVVEQILKYLNMLIDKGMLDRNNAIIQPEWRTMRANAKPWIHLLYKSGIRFMPQNHKTWGAE